MSAAQDLIDDARNYASTQLTNAQIQMNAAMNILAGLHAATGGGLDFEAKPPEPVKPGKVPEAKSTGFKDPGFKGTAPSYSDPGTLDTSGAPGPSPAMPQFIMPAKPQGEPQDTTGNPPTINEVTDVPPPKDLLAEIESIPVPVLTTITIPPPPTYVPPEFTGTVPSAPPPPPTDLGGTMQGEYMKISPIMVDAVTAEIDAFLDREFPQFRPGMAKLEARLDKYLNGGSALSQEVEDAIFNRTLDKTNTESTRASRKAWGEAGRMGFTIPSPILVAQQYDIDQGRRDNNVRAAIDIAIKQAELEQNNLQFAVTQSAMLRKVAIDSGLAYYNGLVAINGQALQYAQGVVDSIVKAYDIAAKYCEIQARIYESQAHVYEVLLKGSMATIEVYVMRIKALESIAQIDMAQVTLYTARINAVNAEANVYRSYIDGIKAEAEIERMKVELYTAEVGAYVAKMNGYSARWQGFSAAVNGESAKMHAASEEQQAWASKSVAYSAVINGRTAALQGKISVNEGKMKNYQVAVEAYTAQVQGLAAVARAEIESYSATIQAFQAEANSISSYSQAQIAQYSAALRAAETSANVIVANLREANAVEMQKVVGMSAVATAAGGIYSAAAQASLSGMNSLASVSAEESA